MIVPTPAYSFIAVIGRLFYGNAFRPDHPLLCAPAVSPKSISIIEFVHLQKRTLWVKEMGLSPL